MRFISILLGRPVRIQRNKSIVSLRQRSVCYLLTSNFIQLKFLLSAKNKSRICI
jgi:hypothetical protein